AGGAPKLPSEVRVIAHDASEHGSHMCDGIEHVVMDSKHGRLLGWRRAPACSAYRRTPSRARRVKAASVRERAREAPPRSGGCGLDAEEHEGKLVQAEQAGSGDRGEGRGRGREKTTR